MAVKEVTSIDMKYGYVTVNKSALMTLPKPVWSRAIATLLQYVSANIRPVTYKQLQYLLAKLPDLQKTISLHGCCVFPLRTGVLGVSAIMWEIKPQPITIGEPMHWSNKWNVQILPASGSTQCKDRKYFVRSFIKADYAFVRRGVRMVRSAKLPPVLARYALPVIMDQDGKVALIPHFKYRNRDFGISATVRHNPLLTLDSIVQQHD